MFEHILNWKLLRGSHKFPGPDGGTCINEAAVVAAGFKYRSVSRVSDCPPCFSVPIAGYTIVLNDRMPDELRQKLLMPFVTRLAGTADEPAVERARIGLIIDRTKRDILSLDTRYAYAAYALDAYAAADDDADLATGYAAAYAHYVTSFLVVYDAYAAAMIWETTASILDEAIRLGNQAQPIEIDLVIKRMERAKRDKVLA